MGQSTLRFQHVSFAYPSSVNNLVSDFSADLTRGWTGIIGPNGAGKTTLLKLATQSLVPDAGRILFSGRTRYCRQRTDNPPENFHDFVNSFDKAACRIMGLLDIDPAWTHRWDTLSHGERKRAQIAAALYERPDVLAVDEPTNHLDADARTWIMDTLLLFRGTGLLVSHDRALLDRLCRRCIFIDPPDITVITGNYTQSRKQRQQMQAHLDATHSRARQRVRQLKREADRRRREAAASDQRTSKKRISLKDHDAKSKIDLAKLSGKDGAAGKQLNQISGRLSQARKTLAGIPFKKTYKTGICMTGTPSKRNILAHLPKGRLELSPDKALVFNDLYIRPGDRIGITGRNGCGKTTLLRHIVNAMGPDPQGICYLPQEIPLAGAMEEIQEIRQLPGDILGTIMVRISRLGSRPERLLETIRPSPGEIRKILLARHMSMSPHIIIMDEPTNHLDLPSVELLEAALMSCTAALVLVSHDKRFIRHLTRERWTISRTDRDPGNGRVRKDFILDAHLS
ncbi:MAG: ATP-binding cassette domain-containing protein [Desulfobacter sp.]